MYLSFSIFLIVYFIVVVEKILLKNFENVRIICGIWFIWCFRTIKYYFNFQNCLKNR